MKKIMPRWKQFVVYSLWFVVIASLSALWAFEKVWNFISAFFYFPRSFIATAINFIKWDWNEMPFVETSCLVLFF